MKECNKRCQILKWCDRLSVILLCAIMFDCCIFGAGELLSIGPLGFRQILLLLLGICCIPMMWKQRKALFSSKYIWVVVAFFVWMVFCAYRGVLNQNTHVAVDFNAFVYLLFVPLAIVTLHSKERVHLLMKVMVAGSLVLAVTSICHLVMYLIDPKFLLGLASLELKLNLARIGAISAKIPRIYFLSALYMIAGCAFSIYFLTMRNDKKCRWLYFLTPGLSLFALMLSYTRSVFLGIFLAVLVVVAYVIIALDKAAKKRFVKQLCAIIAIFAIVTVAFSVITQTNYLAYAFSRASVSFNNSTPSDTPEHTNPDDTDPDNTDPEDTEPDESRSEEEMQQNMYNQATSQSDALRQLTIEESIADIKASPLIGYGLGYTVASRPDGNEYSYLDLWLKTGIIGLLLYFAPFAMIVVNIFRKKSGTICDRHEKILWLAFLLGIMGYSIFNPYINSALGIFVYACVIAVCNNRKTNQDEQIVQ